MSQLNHKIKVVEIFMTVPVKAGSLRNIDGHVNGNATKHEYHCLKEKKSMLLHAWHAVYVGQSITKFDDDNVGVNM